MKTLLLLLLLSSMHLSGEQENVVWRWSDSIQTFEVVRNSAHTRWGGEGRDELSIHIRRARTDTYWHPYMCSLAGLILEGLAMDARDCEVPISIVGGDSKSDTRIRFTLLGDVDIILDDDHPRISLSRMDAIAMAVAVHKEYLDRIVELKQPKEDRDQSKPMKKTEQVVPSDGHKPSNLFSPAGSSAPAVAH